MAQYTEVKILDDLTGDVGAKGHEFAIDGRTYEIDLAGDTYAQLMEILAPYMAAGRRVGPGRRSSMARPNTAGNKGGSYPDGRKLSREESAAIRTWAIANGMQVSDRGRISNEVLDSYNSRDQSAPVPVREVPYAEARSALVRGGENLVGKSKTYVAERYMQLHPNTAVLVEQKVKAAG
jgi:hypothetical protein